MATIPCPFVDTDDRRCHGHIVRIEAYNADLHWEQGASDGWDFEFAPSSAFHLFCSEMGNHEGSDPDGSAQLILDADELGSALSSVLAQTGRIANR